MYISISCSKYCITSVSSNGCTWTGRTLLVWIIIIEWPLLKSFTPTTDTCISSHIVSHTHVNNCIIKSSSRPRNHTSFHNKLYAKANSLHSTATKHTLFFRSVSLLIIPPSVGTGGYWHRTCCIWQCLLHRNLSQAIGIPLSLQKCGSVWTLAPDAGNLC